MKSTGKKEVIEADMVLLAMGFLKPEQPKFAENVFVAGDAAHGAQPRSTCLGRRTTSGNRNRSLPRTSKRKQEMISLSLIFNL